MRKTVLVVGILLMGFAVPAFGASAWYQISFTGADMWNYSAYDAGMTAVNQSAPHRYATYDPTTGDRLTAATTWGVAPPMTTGNFVTWATSAAGQAYGIDQFNLWGADNLGASWGEAYVSVGTDGPNPGVSSWPLVSSPTIWNGANGIVEGGQSYSADATHAFPVCCAGTGTLLTQANKNNPRFTWTFDVLISNPEASVASDGTIRVWWGGNDSTSMGGNDDVAGIMMLKATQIADPIPEPVTMFSAFLGLSSLGMYIRKRIKRQAAA